MNPHRDDVVLDNLNPPVAGTQALQGTLVTLSEIELATVAAPTRPTGSDFDYDVRTNDFAAVNAYYHNDRFFQLVENLGFTLATYFDGTAFPVEIDHRDRLGVEQWQRPSTRTASATVDGIDHACYELADLTDTRKSDRHRHRLAVGAARAWRPRHPLRPRRQRKLRLRAQRGRQLRGDPERLSLGVAQRRRFDRFLSRRSRPSSCGDRIARSLRDGAGAVANDDDGYSSEQILSTTLFRVYRSIGGDSTDVSRREFAARYMAYLMLRAVGTLTPMSNPEYAGALPRRRLLAADAGDWTSEGVFGGAYGKVLTWSFEKQNLNDGALPSVDVYIDDGRAGEYAYLPVYWETATIWNRLNADGLTGHQEPARGHQLRLREDQEPWDIGRERRDRQRLPLQAIGGPGLAERSAADDHAAIGGWNAPAEQRRGKDNRSVLVDARDERVGPRQHVDDRVGHRRSEQHRQIHRR